MKTTFLSTLMISSAMLLSACQVQYPDATHQANQPHQIQHDRQALKQYRWSYVPPNAPRPIVVVFRQDRINIQTGCNRLAGTWQTQHHQLKVSPLVGTKMACAPALMALEMLASNLFSDRVLDYRVEMRSGVAILNLKDARGQIYRFTGSPKQRED